MRNIARAVGPLKVGSARSAIVLLISLTISSLSFAEFDGVTAETKLKKSSTATKKMPVAGRSNTQKLNARKMAAGRMAARKATARNTTVAKHVAQHGSVNSRTVKQSLQNPSNARRINPSVLHGQQPVPNKSALVQNLPLKAVMPVAAPSVVLTSGSQVNTDSQTSLSPGPSRLQPATLSAENMASGTSPAKRLNVDFRVGVSGVELASEFDNMQSAGMRFGLDGRYVLLPKTLDMHLSATAFFFAGHVQSRLADLQNNSFLWLNEGIVTWKPVSILGFDAGAIDQSSFDMPLVVGYRAFPGMRETLKTEGKWGSVQLQAEQAIPTSPNLRSKATEREEIPQFNTENLSVKLEGLGPVVAKAKVFHYGFRNLPASIAYQGGIYGNTVNGSSEELSSFEYDFDGFGVGGGLSCDVYHGFKLSIGAQGYQNTKAPEGQKEARAFILGAELPFGKDLIVKPRWEQYFAEADVAPAYYGEMMYGRANREGNVYRLDFAFPESDFKVSTYYSEAAPLIETPTQSPQRYLGFLFEATLKGF